MIKLKCLILVVIGVFVLAGCKEEPIVVDSTTSGGSTLGKPKAMENNNGINDPNAGGQSMDTTGGKGGT